MHGFTFRLGMKFSDGRRLPIEDLDFMVHEDAETVVWLKAADPIQDSTWVSLFGTSFTTEDEALIEGERWRLRLSRALAVLSIGVDFGDRAGGGGISEEWQAQAKSEGIDLYYATHGLMAFPDSDAALFVRMEAVGTARPAEDVMVRALTQGLASNPLNERERIAFELFSASQFVAHIPDARLVMLVSAIEALVDTNTRSVAALSYLDSLQASVEAETSIESDEKENFVAILGNMKRESVGRAAARLLRPFADRQYGGLDAVRFYKKCYGLRSSLVHGHEKRPGEQQVRQAGADLENLVGHVIAGRDLVSLVLEHTPFA